MKFLTLFLVSLPVLASWSIGTFNIRNFHSKVTDEVLLKKVIEENLSDIIAVQEIVDVAGFSRFISKNFSNYRLEMSRCGGGGRQKLGFLYNSHKYKLVRSWEDKRFENVSGLKCGSLRPALVAIFSSTQTKDNFAVVNLHLKSGTGSRNFSRRWKQYRLMTLIQKDLLKEGIEDVIYIGDLNTTGYSKQNMDYRQFQKMLLDVRGTSSAKYTECTAYWSGKNRQDNIEEPSTLDHIILTGKLNSQNFQVNIGSHCHKVRCERSYQSSLGQTYSKVSDHCPISVKFK